MSSSPAHALHPTERETTCARGRTSARRRAGRKPVTIGILAARWYRLNKGRLRAIADRRSFACSPF